MYPVAVAPNVYSPQAGQSPGWIEAAIGAVGGLLTGGPAGAIAGGIAGYGVGGGETATSPGVPETGFGIAAGCPTGYRWDGNRCVKTGIVGTIQQWVPGGQTGVLPEAVPEVGYGEAVIGAFGVPAMVPAQVGQTQYGPILRCPTGAVLGKDNLCYQKGTISNKQRKWPKPARPLLTGGDMKTLRRAKTLEGRVKRAWSAAGSPGQRKTCSRKHR